MNIKNDKSSNMPNFKFTNCSAKYCKSKTKKVKFLKNIFLFLSIKIIQDINRFGYYKKRAKISGL